MAKSDSSNPTPRRRKRKAAPKRTKKARGGPAIVSQDVPVEAVMQPDDETVLDVIIEDGVQLIPRVDPETGALEIPHEDGSILVDFTPEIEPDIDATQHDVNLALKLDSWALSGIAEDLLDGIQSDDDSRSDWIEQRTRGIDLLGLKLEQPRSGASTSSAPLDGMSVYRDPTLNEAVLRFQANAQGELLPAAGPVKTVVYGSANTQKDTLAEALEKDLNYYLTTTATEYYPDTRRMFYWTGFSGLAFKKVYRCPLRRRPVSESVDATDLIVSDTVTDLRNAQRITHQISMRYSTMKRMQILGVYRDCDLSIPTPADPNSVKDKINQVQGISPSTRPQDQPYTVYECYCELDIPGFEHKEDGKVTGLPLPYRVTVEKDSRQILEIRRNWKEGDEDFQAKIPFVAYPYATGLGFYGIGLLHILGNLTTALTALTREAIDAGMFANFPGGLMAKENSRQMQNEFRAGPGAFIPVETGGRPIKDMVMSFPYHEAGPGHMSLIESLRGQAQRVGGAADTGVGEGKQDAPVGTTLALIEQATKIEGAVHKALHAAQGEEFQLLCELFREDPEALWRGNKRPALAEHGDKVAMFKAALDRCDIVPKADPNVPSHMHRVMKANAIRQMAMTAPPGTYNLKAVDERALAMMDVDSAGELFAAPQAAQPPPIDLVKMAEVEVKRMAEETKRAKMAFDAKEKAKDRESKQNVEVLKLVTGIAVHPGSESIVDEQLIQMSPLMSNIKSSMNQGGLGGLGPPLRFAPPRPMMPPMQQGMR
jgi:hypothetical protein